MLSEFELILSGIILGIFCLLFFFHLFLAFNRIDENNVDMPYAFLNLGCAIIMYGSRLHSFLFPLIANFNIIILGFGISIVGFSFTDFTKEVFKKKHENKVSLQNIKYIKTLLKLNFIYFLTSALIFSMSFNKIAILVYFAIQIILAFLLVFYLLLYCLFNFKFLGLRRLLVLIGIIGIVSIFALGTLSYSLGKIIPLSIYYGSFLVVILLFFISVIAGFIDNSKKLIKANNLLNDLVIEIEEEKESTIRFFMNIAHEVRNPVTGVLISLEEYIRECKCNERSIDINIIDAQSAGERLKKTVTDLLDLQNLKAGKIIYNHDHYINFSAYLSMIINDFIPFAKCRGVTIKTSIDEGVKLKAAPGAIDRVVGNIMENAVKYNRIDGHIHVILRNEKNKVVLSISDNGIGIPAEQHEKVFDKFYQIKNHKLNSQGVGLGLSLVKQIIAGMNGNIKLESEVDKGSTFTLTFPGSSDNLEALTLNKYKPDVTTFMIIGCPEADNIRKLNDNESYNSKLPNILYVEDEYVYHRVLRARLKGLYNIYSAANGVEGLELLDERGVKPELIITDLWMDKMNGLEFYKNVVSKDGYSNIPFIYLSAVLDKQTIIDATYNGVEYITKPYSVDVVAGKIESILKNKSLRYDEVKKSKEEQLKDKQTKIINDMVEMFKLKSGDIQAIQFCLEDLSVKELAYNNNMTESAIKKARTRLFNKAGVADKNDLMAKYFNFDS